MDDENNGKPYFLMDDLEENPLFFGNTHVKQKWVVLGKFIVTKSPVGHPKVWGPYFSLRNLM